MRRHCEPGGRVTTPVSVAVALLALGWSQPFDGNADLAAIGVSTLVVPGTDLLHASDVGEAYLRAIPQAERGELSAAALAAFVAGLLS